MFSGVITITLVDRLVKTDVVAADQTSEVRTEQAV
jgi:hypothetical protein